MINRFLNKSIFVLVVIALLILVSIPFQIKIDNQRSKFRSIEETLYLSSSTLKKMSLGFDEVLSDIYWFRSIQYLGSDETKFSNKDSELLHNYFDIMTDLDPKFVNAYRFGGSFLAEPIPIGLNDFDKGTDLYDKGRLNNPKHFRLPYEEAFLYYLYSNDYSKAADLFEEASEKVSTDFRKASLKGMAATARLRGGDRELSKKIWEEIYETTQNEGRKEFALQNLRELKTKDFEDRLSKLVRKFNSDFGRLPSNLEELVKHGYLKKVPKDHRGERFIIAPNIKAVKSIALVKKFFKENIGYLNSRSERFKTHYGRYPNSMSELKRDIKATSVTRDYPEHPLGEEYIYDPKTGVVDYDKSFLN